MGQNDRAKGNNGSWDQASKGAKAGLHFFLRMPDLTLRSLFLAAGLLIVGAGPLVGQEAAANLGIRAVGALGLQAGQASIQRGIVAKEAGVVLDLGHLPSRRLRVTAAVSFLRSARHHEYVLSEDAEYSSIIFDLSGHVGLQGLLRRPESTFVPYVSAAVGVHALASSFGTVSLDRRYNTNVFGVTAGGGARYRIGQGHALVVDWAAQAAREVNRQTVRVGAEWLFGDLKR